MIRCPKCPLTAEAAGQLALHLRSEHGMDEAAALQAAWKASERAPAPHPLTATRDVESPEEDTPMGRPAGSGDPTKPCGYCKRPKDNHTPACPKGAGGKGKRARASKAPPPRTPRAEVEGRRRAA